MLKLPFDPNQPHQTAAIKNIVQLFNGWPHRVANFTLSDEAKIRLADQVNLKVI